MQVAKTADNEFLCLRVAAHLEAEILVTKFSSAPLILPSSPREPAPVPVRTLVAAAAASGQSREEAVMDEIPNPQFFDLRQRHDVPAKASSSSVVSALAS